MEYAINQLIANLNSESLKFLPCFYDRPDQIQFRIGLNEGPRIVFRPETDDVYYLFVNDENDNHIYYPVLISSDNFQQCQSIYQSIRALCISVDYTKMRDDRIEILITNLVNIIRPVISRLPEK